jgi:hypothetical protein
VTKPKIDHPWPPKGAAPELKNLKQVLQRAGVSPATWSRLPGTPKPVAISPRLRMFWSSEVDSFLEALPRAGGQARPEPLRAVAATPEPPRRTPRRRGRPRGAAMTATASAD